MSIIVEFLINGVVLIKLSIRVLGRTSVTPQSRERVRADEGFQWLPGDVLPQNGDNLHETSHSQIGSFLSYMQKMESKLDTICDKLDSIESRVSTLEQNPPVLAPCSASGCSSCETSSEGKKRSRRSPPELQVSFNMALKGHFTHFVHTLCSFKSEVFMQHLLMIINCIIMRGKYC